MHLEYPYSQACLVAYVLLSYTVHFIYRKYHSSDYVCNKSDFHFKISGVKVVYKLKSDFLAVRIIHEFELSPSLHLLRP